MILVDSSVWIEHFRHGEPRLEALLAEEMVTLHPFVLGELVSGNLRDRQRTITCLRLLPEASLAPEQEVHHLLESRRLWSRGLGWIDLHLLASALLDRCQLWTHDQALGSAAALIQLRFI
jgi:predicted nucleic acid-binding protein